MARPIYSAIFVIPLLLNSAVCSRHSLDYIDLLDTGYSCDRRDTCETLYRSFNSTSCECDNMCHQYNDCCIDADQSTASRMRLSRTCMRYGLNENALYVVSRCSRNFRGARNIRQKCEVLYDVEDPMVASPITDTRNNITYKNLYCAECNSANKNYLQSWNIGVACPTLNNANSTHGNISGDYLEENMVFNGNKWGIEYWSVNQSRTMFHACEIVFNLPADMKKHVRFCRPDIIGTCHPTWRQITVKSQCEAYMAVVYHDNETYRNPHCALCNFIESELHCTVGADVQSRKKPSMSFTLLLDVNMRDGNKVGELPETRCSVGKKYDPFFKKCRTLTCALPGYKIVNGQCVRP